ncbi:hypothetical protein OBBRIDRAFT_557440 [Obba rivulosa]|uniref:Uncharacterized protein n=1 Tax=Obba rivulosa TaxID=1052685 RepID=A0A8E2AU66_9APHY|nr:hypothetical protein OBBRIDRAFT_557440 [Obba rivulosa]
MALLVPNVVLGFSALKLEGSSSSAFQPKLPSRPLIHLVSSWAVQPVFNDSVTSRPVSASAVRPACNSLLRFNVQHDRSS